MENNSKKDIKMQIQELVNYISEQKKTLELFHKRQAILLEKSDSSKSNTTTFLSKFLPKQKRNTIKSLIRTKELEELDNQIFLLATEIEKLEGVLYKLQHEFSETNKNNNNTKNITKDDTQRMDEDNKEPYNN